MKKLFAVILCAIFLFGCASAPVAMKSRTRFFRPITTFAQIKKSEPQNASRFASQSIIKELSEKNTTIELLKSENQRLRERVAKLEKRLAITES